MLVLSRKPGERILIGENIAITIVRISNETVRVGIEAPNNTAVIREELVLRKANSEAGLPLSQAVPSQVTASY